MLSTVVGTSTVIPATLAFLGRKHFPLPVTLILAHVAASGFVVAIAATDKFASSSTFILGKVIAVHLFWTNLQYILYCHVPQQCLNCVREASLIYAQQPSGKISWWGWALFWPYHVALRTKLWIQRQTRVEPVWNHITDGWYDNIEHCRLIGGMHSGDEAEEKTYCPCRYLGGWPASPKMLPEGAPAILDCTCELPRVQRHLPYDNLPVWDTHGERPLHFCLMWNGLYLTTPINPAADCSAKL